MVSQPDRFPELLAAVAEKVRGKTIGCTGHPDNPQPSCVPCRESDPNPLYAALRDVLTEECPCGLATHPVSSRLPYEEFSPICKTCYLRGRHDKHCDCDGTGDIPRRVWETLREQGIKGALRGAIEEWIDHQPLPVQDKYRDVYADYTKGQYDSDHAALEGVKEAMG